MQALYRPAKAAGDEVERYLAAGGQVTRCPTAYLQPVEGAEPLPPVPSYDRALSEQRAEEGRQRARRGLAKADSSRRATRAARRIDES